MPIRLRLKAPVARLECPFWRILEKIMVMRKNFRIFFRLLLWGDSGIES